MFDPENITRFDMKNEAGFDARVVIKEDGMCVHSADYDQLLDIHLRHVRMIAGLFSKCGEPLSEEKIASLKNGTWR